jgi:TRAP-type mannitol/chloroaromatic compound transport system substrate-binding protein
MKNIKEFKIFESDENHDNLIKALKTNLSSAYDELNDDGGTRIKIYNKNDFSGLATNDVLDINLRKNPKAIIRYSLKYIGNVKKDEVTSDLHYF